MPTLNLLILGATGGTGRQIVEQALLDGHRITAVVRDASKLGSTGSQVHVINGDLLENPSVLDTAVEGQDAVISALGVGQSFTSGQLITRSVPAIVSAMSQSGVRRFVHVSAFGVGATRRDIPLIPRLFTATLLRDVYADKAAGEQAIVASDLDWTIVYPAGLTDGPRTGKYRVGERLPLRGFPKISRADVAECVLRQVTEGTNLRKGVLVAPNQE